MAPPGQPPLDEIQWSDPSLLPAMQGIHSNSVLFYFAQSPFFDRTSNNAVIFQQAHINPTMMPIIQERRTFEAHLRGMSGLEYIVAQEPAEMGWGFGTGVWVIRKQTRRKRNEPGVEDELTVHADYFLVGENIYQAPAFADILSSRIATISSAIGKIFPAADGIQKWTPALGHVYQTPTSTTASRSRALESKEGTPIPDDVTKASSTAQKSSVAGPDSRLAEESFAIHMRYGGEYMDENPITGRPGEFHLSSTGRKDKVVVPPAKPPAAETKTPTETTPLAKYGKSDKKPAPAKPKRRKSKVGTTTPT